jgi:hypothetical protein
MRLVTGNYNPELNGVLVAAIDLDTFPDRIEKLGARPIPPPPGGYKMTH